MTSLFEEHDVSDVEHSSSGGCEVRNFYFSSGDDLRYWRPNIDLLIIKISILNANQVVHNNLFNKSRFFVKFKIVFCH